MARFLRLIALAVLLSSCSDSSKIAELINEKWPPVSIDDQRSAAIKTLADALVRVRQPNVAFALDLGQARIAIVKSQILGREISDVRMFGEQQLLKIEIDFAKEFKATLFETIPLVVDPVVNGTITVYAGVTSAIAQEANKIDLRILPAIKAVKISSVKIDGKFDVPAVGEILSRLVSDFAENISGELSRLSITSISFPTTVNKNLNPSRVLTVHQGEASVDLQLDSESIELGASLSTVLWLIDDNAIFGLAEIISSDRLANEAQSFNVLPTFDSTRESFMNILNSSFAMESPIDGVWVAVRKELLAGKMNSAINQASACFTADAVIPKQKFKEKIEFPDETSIDCTPTRNCTPTRDCTFEKSRDKRNCEACLLRNPFNNNCITRGNDPICEAAKASQNAAYDVAYSARKADCERLKSQEKGTCELEKSSEKALCETGKETLKRLARTGNFANLEGAVSGTARVRSCLTHFYAADTLESVNFNLELSGSADSHLSLKFVPLDIVGHLTCQWPWTEEQDFRAAIPQTSVPVMVDITPSYGDRSVSYTLSVTAGEIPLTLSPGPTEFILTSMNLALSCPGLNLAKPLIISATPFVPELKGEFLLTPDPVVATFKIDLPVQTVGDVSLSAELSENAAALIIRGKVD